MSNIKDFIIENGVLVKYAGRGGDVVVPAGVTEIGDKVFRNRSRLTSVTLPDGLIKIGFCAFEKCSALTNITFPDSVKKIAERAFESCSGLKSVTIPEGVTEIGEGAFAWCSELTAITLFCEMSGDVSEIFKNSPIAKYCSNSIEKICAPKYDIGLTSKMKVQAARGFAQLAVQGYSFEEEYREKYAAYIKRQKKKMYPVAMEDEYLLTYLLGNKLIPSADIPSLISLAQEYENTQAQTKLTEYKNANFPGK